MVLSCKAGWRSKARIRSNSISYDLQCPLTMLGGSPGLHDTHAFLGIGLNCRKSIDLPQVDRIHLDHIPWAASFLGRLALRGSIALNIAFYPVSTNPL